MVEVGVLVVVREEERCVYVYVYVNGWGCEVRKEVLIYSGRTGAGGKS